MNDTRPENCRFRMIAERKPYSTDGSCDECGPINGIRLMCPRIPPFEREPPRIGYYPEAGLQLSVDAFTEKRWFPRFDNIGYATGITANQAREASHLLAQLAEYLEWQEQQSRYTTAAKVTMSPVQSSENTPKA